MRSPSHEVGPPTPTPTSPALLLGSGSHFILLTPTLQAPTPAGFLLSHLNGKEYVIVYYMLKGNLELTNCSTIFSNFLTVSVSCLTVSVHSIYKWLNFNMLCYFRILLAILCTSCLNFLNSLEFPAVTTK